MTKTLRALLGAALFATQAAQVKAEPPSHSVQLPLDAEVTPAKLISIPDNVDMQREYPSLPRMMALPGRATMVCKVTIAGTLDDCHVASEEPAGLGFGAATVRTAAYFRVQPASRDGRPVEGTIIIPIHWQMDAAAPVSEPPLPPAPAASLLLARRVLELEGVATRMQTAVRPLLDQSMAELALSDDAQRGARALDAFHMGLSDEIAHDMDRQAHVLAVVETEAQLKATIAFLESGAGHAWVQAQTQIETRSPQDFYARVAKNARSHLEETAPAQPPAAAAAQP